VAHSSNRKGKLNELRLNNKPFVMKRSEGNRHDEKESVGFCTGGLCTAEVRSHRFGGRQRLFSLGGRKKRTLTGVCPLNTSKCDWVEGGEVALNDASGMTLTVVGR